MEASFYEYTKSAQRIKKFKCEEKCREIAAEYEKFNVENRVYEFFGEKLLEEAKEHYSMIFGDKDILKYLRERGVEPPNNKFFEYEKKIYDESKAVRDVFTYCFFDNKFQSNYYWYTLCQIVKAYNGKNGCVVTKTPIAYKSGNTRLWIEIDWSKEAEEYATKEKFIREAKNENPMWIMAACGGMCGILLSNIILVAFSAMNLDTLIALKIIENWVIFVFFCAIVFAIVGCTIVRKEEILRKSKKLSKQFDIHCDRIKETRASYFRVYEGTLTTKFYD